METAAVPWAVFQLDVRDKGARGLQKPAVVEEAEDSATLLGEGIQDEAVFYRKQRENRSDLQNVTVQMVIFSKRLYFMLQRPLLTL